jgi:hypothetical protein
MARPDQRWCGASGHGALKTYVKINNSGYVHKAACNDSVTSNHCVGVGRTMIAATGREWEFRREWELETVHDR